MLRELNPLLHSELRLAVMSILISVESADFVYLREQTGATAGNLSVQIDKLQQAGYITVTKGFNGKKPRTTCAITEQGTEAFSEYVDALRSYIGKVLYHADKLAASTDIAPQKESACLCVKRIFILLLRIYNLLGFKKFFVEELRDWELRPRHLCGGKFLGKVATLEVEDTVGKRAFLPPFNLVPYPLDEGRHLRYGTRHNIVESLGDLLNTHIAGVDILYPCALANTLYNGDFLAN